MCVCVCACMCMCQHSFIYTYTPVERTHKRTAKESDMTEEEGRTVGHVTDG